MRTKLALGIGALVLAVGAFVGGHVAGAHQDFRCPAEDSCRVDYHDGAWHFSPDAQ